MDHRYGCIRFNTHFVFVTKYGYQFLRADLGLKVLEWIHQTYQAFEIEILKGVVNKGLRSLFEQRAKRVFNPYPDFQSVILTHQLLAGGCSVL